MLTIHAVQTYWRNILSRYQQDHARPIFTSTRVKMWPHAQIQHLGLHEGAAATSGTLRALKPDFIPVYTLLGMCILAVVLGSITLKQQLLHSPNVVVDKKKRKTIPELNYPDDVVKKSEDFVNKSFFRRVAGTTKWDSGYTKLMPWTLQHRKEKSGERQIPADTLKSVGIDPAEI
eukprot:PITA_00879